MRDVLELIGRLLFFLLFAASGVAHVTKTRQMAGYTASRGVPMAFAATFVSGVVMLAGAVSVALGIWAALGALAPAAFCFAHAGRDLGLVITGPALSVD
ncbi:DoxX family membrane protein [Streptomyces xanthophaeus]